MAVVFMAVLLMSGSSQLNTQAIPGHLNTVLIEYCALGRVDIKYWVGVVDMDKDLARPRQAVEYLDHAACPALRQMAHLTAELVADFADAHFIVAPQGAIDQQAIGATHPAEQLFIDLAQARRIKQRAARLQVFDKQADVVARVRIAAMR